MSPAHAGPTEGDHMSLCYADYEGLEGQEFQVHIDEDRSLTLLLEDCSRSDSQHEGHETFSVLFLGPKEPLLSQKSYPLTHPNKGRIIVFLVPIDMRETGVTYEAVYSVKRAT